MIKKLFVSSFIMLFLLPHIFNSGEYHVDRSKQNQVKFISDAPIEDFEGVTDNIDGYIYWEGEVFTNKSDLYFEVDLRTIDTGIGLRNKHMRENYLHTDKYSHAIYSGKIINSEKITDYQYEVIVNGEMNIHGVTKPLKIKGKINITDSGYFINSYFEVKLSDYKIEIPKLMFMKINEIIKLEINFHTTAAQ